MSDGPFLVIAAFWQPADNAAEVAKAVSRARFPEPEGWPRGCVVAFRREVATLPAFQRDLRRFDLAELIPSAALRRDAVQATKGKAG